MISQVYGLAQQFGTNITHIQTKLIFPWSKFQPGFLPIFSWVFKNKLDFKKKPDLIISCGRKSVYLSLFFKKKFLRKIITIHIQNPKINFKKFDYIIAPNHDEIMGEKIKYFVDENMLTNGGKFRGKNIYHPSHMKQNDNILIFLENSISIKQRLSNLYKGKYIII